jgi:hypothetical protein
MQPGASWDGWCQSKAAFPLCRLAQTGCGFGGTRAEVRWVGLGLSTADTHTLCLAGWDSGLGDGETTTANVGHHPFAPTVEDG